MTKRTGFWQKNTSYDKKAVSYDIWRILRKKCAMIQTANIKIAKYITGGMQYEQGKEARKQDGKEIGGESS